MPNINPIKSGPKDVFTHLLMFVCLYLSAFSFIALIFDYINQLFKDPLTYHYDWGSNALRYEVASLIIVFPLYLFIAILIERGFTNEPARREIKIRKWLVYLTLFIAAITIITDLVTLIYNFLGGDLTLAFVLKVLTVLLVTAAVFSYYFYDVRENSNLPKKKIAWTAGIVVALIVTSAFFIIGSPMSQRDKRFDNDRINDLQSVQNAVIDYYNVNNALPNNLQDIKTSRGFNAPLDPETGASYQYNRIDAKHFDLCATFATDTVTGFMRPMNSFYDNTYWDHTNGDYCFHRDIAFFYAPNGPIAKPIAPPPAMKIKP